MGAKTTGEEEIGPVISKLLLLKKKREVDNSSVMRLYIPPKHPMNIGA